MSKRTLMPVILNGGPEGSYAVNFTMSLDENYILTAQLIDQDGNALGDEQTVDLPLESVVVGGSYDSATQSIILTLDNGNEITIPVSGLVSGLQPTIDTNNKLNADYVADGTTNKVFTAAEQSKLSGIAANAEVNVQADWTESDSGSDSFILHKPTLGTMAAESASDYTPTASLGSMAFANTSDYTPTASLATVATSGQYSDLSGIPTINDSTITIEQDGVTAGTFTLNQSSNATISLTGGSGGGNQWFGTQNEFDNLSTYDENTDYFIKDKIDYRYDISHKPDLNKYAVKSEVDSKNLEQDSKIATLNGSKFITQQEYDNLANKQEGVNYFIEGNAVEMVVTFTDQSTATYYVMVD